MLSKTQNAKLAQTYAQAWFALKGETIWVSVDDNGLFQVQFSDSNKNLLPEWGRKLGFGELLDSLSRITETMQFNRLRSKAECGLLA